MPTRSGCILSSDPTEQNENIMAAKPTEPKAECEKEPTISDLYQLVLSSKAELKLEIQNSTTEIQLQIDTITTRIDTVESKFDQHKTSVEQKLTEAQSKFLPSDEFNSTIVLLEKRIEQLENSASYQAAIINKQAEKLASLDNDKRRSNLIIHGVKEKDSPPPRQVANDLFTELGVPFGEGDCDYIYRIGPSQQGNDRPRPILIQLTKLRHKGEVFRNVHKLKDKAKWAPVHISEDLTDENSRKQRDLKAIAALATDLGYEARVNGLTISIDGKKFTYNNIDQLPDDLTLSAAKTIKVKNGIAFQGPHSPLSAMHKCPIVDGDNDYKSLEQGYFHKAATHHQMPGLARTILMTEKPFELHDLGKKIKYDQVWNNGKLNTLDELNYQKFSQNPSLRKFLLDTGKATLYEATKDPFYGCGLTLAQRKSINDQSPGKNEFGKSVMRARDRLLAETGGAPTT